jgi:hypothetical protein
MQGVQWYYISDGQRFGPVPHTHMVELLTSGSVPSEARVWRQGLESWVTASSVLHAEFPEVPPAMSPGTPLPWRAPQPASPTPPTQTEPQPRQPETIGTSRIQNPADRQQRMAAGGGSAAPVGVGGWLLLLCIGLTIIGPIKTLAGIATAVEVVETHPLVPIIAIGTAADVMVRLLGMVAGVALWSRKRSGVWLAKAFFWATPIVGVLVAGIALVVTPRSFLPGVLGTYFVLVLVGTVIAVVWTSYLSRSKRVAATYGLLR